MKQLPLQNESFRYIEQAFKEWLDILGYAPQTVYGMPLQVREFLHYLEQQNIHNLQQTDTTIIKAYYQQLSHRANNKTAGGLSAAHLNKHLQALRKFTDYLRQVGRINLPPLPLRNEEKEEKTIPVLSTKEMETLFKATEKDYPHPFRSPEFVETLKSRDRAMLAIFYGCGARRNEGVNINVADINFDRATLHIRKGKRHKERIVPVGKKALHYLQEWVYDYRGIYLGTVKTDALFISERGQRVSGQTLILRLKMLQYLSQEKELIEKEIGLHTLRHSIATHLLANGMELEEISRFLGHSSLDSTQIYTHLKDGL